MSSFTGSPPPNANVGGKKLKSYQQFTPEQMQLFQSLFSQVGPDSYLARLAAGDSGLFEEMERPALRQFSGLQGNLASRFSGMGTGGRHSSGFQQASTGAASQFAQDLQGRRQELQRDAIQQLFGLSNNLLGQRPYEQYLTDKKPSFLESLLGGEQGIFGGGGENMDNLFKVLKFMGMFV